MMLCAFHEGLDQSFYMVVTLLEQSNATAVLARLDLNVTPSDLITQ